MKVYDISVPIYPGMTIYPGDEPVSIAPRAQIKKGDAYNTSHLSLGSHTGTHIDAPHHFFEGAKGVDELPLNILLGKAWVCEVKNPRGITASTLSRAGIPQGTSRLLLKTRNSLLWSNREFQKDYVYLRPAAARWLVERGVRLVGIDYLSLERFGSRISAAHLTLLKAGAIIVEGLNLKDIRPGEYTLVCLPLKIVGCDGAPARAALIDEKE
ncbi:MAG: cyclase family protein [Chloroflexi bacterium]|nr:cyclase family protein [Chloroflexota bacterium]